MSTHYEDTYVKCPFFKKRHGKNIICEGVEEGSNITLGFSYMNYKEDYEAARCKSSYEKCPIYRMLENLY